MYEENIYPIINILPEIRNPPPPETHPERLPFKSLSTSDIWLKTKTSELVYHPAEPFRSYRPEDKSDSFDSNDTDDSHSEELIIPKEEVFQAGGHGGVYREELGKIRKKTTKQETKFYTTLQSNIDIPDPIKKLCPQFHGKRKEVTKYKTNHYIILEDITADLEKPCIMDIKMGTVTAGKDSNFVKKQVVLKKDKETTSFVKGLRIVGARVYNKETGSYRIIGRSEGYHITENQLPAYISSFLYNGSEFHSVLLEFFIKQLKIILEWMNSQCHYRFYSSSLLFVYDGAGSTPDKLKADLRMIDFAHVIKSDDGDHGYLTGLSNLLDFLQHFVGFSSEQYENYLKDIFPLGKFPDLSKLPKTNKPNAKFHRIKKSKDERSPSRKLETSGGTPKSNKVSTSNNKIPPRTEGTTPRRRGPALSNPALPQKPYSLILQNGLQTNSNQPRRKRPKLMKRQSTAPPIRRRSAEVNLPPLASIDEINNHNKSKSVRNDEKKNLIAGSAAAPITATTRSRVGSNASKYKVKQQQQLQVVDAPDRELTFERRKHIKKKSISYGDKKKLKESANPTKITKSLDKSVENGEKPSPSLTPKPFRLTRTKSREGGDQETASNTTKNNNLTTEKALRKAQKTRTLSNRNSRKIQ